LSPAIYDESEIRSLLLHAERMVLWQSVISWDDNTLQCQTQTQADPLNPLRLDGRLSSLHLGEYGAQMMAIHGALLARKKECGKLAPGVLTSLRDFEMRVSRIDDISAPLMGSARILLATAAGSIYEFEICAKHQRIASGRVSVNTL
jgi:predicted hotdog family 3-hydroxylacyl-ACP dehydratase